VKGEALHLARLARLPISQSQILEVPVAGSSPNRLSLMLWAACSSVAARFSGHPFTTMHRSPALSTPGAAAPSGPASRAYLRLNGADIIDGGGRRLASLHPERLGAGH